MPVASTAERKTKGVRFIDNGGIVQINEPVLDAPQTPIPTTDSLTPKASSAPSSPVLSKNAKKKKRYRQKQKLKKAEEKERMTRQNIEGIASFPELATITPISQPTTTDPILVESRKGHSKETTKGNLVKSNNEQEDSKV